jgi:hypothetical protein
MAKQLNIAFMDDAKLMVATGAARQVKYSK